VTAIGHAEHELFFPEKENIPNALACKKAAKWLYKLALLCHAAKVLLAHTS
jgi:hypothetical protein